jgi:5-methylthioadenosine/S-adenosylhomocysteine deaminase
VGFIVETGQADDSQEVLQSCAEEVGIKAVIDWYDQVPSEQPACARITTGIHLPEEEDITEDTLQSMIALRAQHPSKLLMTHCLENAWRQDLIFKKFGMSTVELMESRGLLDDHAVLFHCILVSETDIALLSRRKANVVCCPISSQRIGEGIMPVSKMLTEGVSVVLGTDFLDHDIWDCLRFLYSELSSSTPHIPHIAHQVFDMANRNAAAIGHDVRYDGTIDVGSDADLCFLEHTHQFDPLIEEQTFSNVLHNVLSIGHASLVKHLMIQGRFILKNGQCTTLNEEQVINAYKDILMAERWQR